MRAYIDIGFSFYRKRRELSDSDLQNIGEFTTENIQKWLKSAKSFSFRYTDSTQDPSDVRDFHAVCGDKDIRWVAEKPERALPTDDLKYKPWADDEQRQEAWQQLRPWLHKKKVL